MIQVFKMFITLDTIQYSKLSELRTNVTTEHDDMPIKTKIYDMEISGKFSHSGVVHQLRTCDYNVDLFIHKSIK